MSKAIGIRFVPYDPNKHLRTHFLGAPLVPASLGEAFDDEVMFLGMIHLPEIAALDKENKLPHSGYLYFFMDTSASSRHMNPIVIHTLEEPDRIIDDYNDLFALEEYRGANKARGVEFFEVEEDAEGCKLLGYPCDWNYENKPRNPLLLTISHYDEDLDFLPELDGFTYVFFGPKGHEFDEAYGFYEYA